MDIVLEAGNRFPQNRLTAAFLIAIATYILFLVARAIYNLYFSPLRNIPGPVFSAISSIPHTYTFFRGNGVPYVKSIHDVYGPVVRIAPNKISYATATGFRAIYGRKEHVKDPDMYIAPPSDAPGIGEADDVNHARIRKYLGPAFSAKALEGQEEMMQEYVDVLVSGLRERGSKKREESADMVKWFDWALYDMIGKLALDFEFGCLAGARYHPRVNNMFTNFKIMGLFYAASAYPWFYKFVRKSLEMMFARRSQNYDVIREIVQNRIKTNDSTKRDFWAYVLAHANKEDIREKELETTGWSIVIAGAETTSSLLAGVIYLLLTHAEHMQRLTAELRTRFASEKEITFDSVSRVPFLIAVLEETLRYYPPAPFGVSRVVTPPEGSQIDGFWLPQGTRISSSHYCLFRSPENFANPDQWVPERWLEDRDDLYEDDNRDALMPFSVGKRNCIGKSLAIVQMRLILARLLWNFDFELCDQSRDWMDQRTYMGWEKGPLLARVSDVKR